MFLTQLSPSFLPTHPTITKSSPNYHQVSYPITHLAPSSSPNYHKVSYPLTQRSPSFLPTHPTITKCLTQLSPSFLLTQPTITKFLTHSPTQHLVYHPPMYLAPSSGLLTHIATRVCRKGQTQINDVQSLSFTALPQSQSKYLRVLEYHLGHSKDVIVTADPFACDTERAGSQSNNDFRPLHFPNDNRFVQTCVTQNIILSSKNYCVTLKTPHATVQL